MGAIANLDQLVNTLTGGVAAKEQVWWYTDNRIGSGVGSATVAGQYTSLWTFNQTPGGQGSAPGGTARVCTNATDGSLRYTSPTGGRTKYLVGACASSNVAGVQIIYDRLVDISGFSATTTTAQTCTGVVPTRYSGAESKGNQIWLEIYTIIGATATTITVEYTNQDGTTGRISKPVAFGGTGRREATRIIIVPLADGDLGVREVTNVDLLASTGTAGDFGVAIVRPIINVPVGLAGTGSLIDCITQLPTLPAIGDDACLTQAWYASTTTSPNTFGTLSFVEA